MKKFINLKDFNSLFEGVSPQKAKMRFEISSNLKKVTKIRKALIDIQQFLTEMSDEIVALKLNLGESRIVEFVVSTSSKSPEEKFKPGVVTKEKTKMRFEISSNLKKVSRIHKGLIDVQQLLTEMSDEIIALRLQYNHLDIESDEILNKMKKNIDNMLADLTAEEGDGIIDHNIKLEKNLEKLKRELSELKYTDILKDMKENIDDMLRALKTKEVSGKKTGMIDNTGRLQRNLERLKHGFLKRRTTK